MWNDYEGVDVTGKWVILLRGDPEMEKQESRFMLYGDDRDKVLIARDKGAAGVLFVSGKKFDANDDLVSMYFDKTQSLQGFQSFMLNGPLLMRSCQETRLTLIPLNPC